MTKKERFANAFKAVIAVNLMDEFRIKRKDLREELILEVVMEEPSWFELANVIYADKNVWL